MSKIFNKVVDSGKRESFDTGSVRDTAENKGMPNLLAAEAFGIIKDWSKEQGYYTGEPVCLEEIEDYLLNFNSIIPERKFTPENYCCLLSAGSATLSYLSQEEKSFYGAMRRINMLYQNGAVKYAKNNWRRGQPISRYYDSAMRHLWRLLDKSRYPETKLSDSDEDHAASVLWNILCIIQTKLDIDREWLPKELDDFPFLLSETFKKFEIKAKK